MTDQVKPNSQVDSLMAVAQMMESLTVQSSNENQKTIDALTRLVGEMKDQQQDLANQVLLQQARISQLESQQQAQQEARVRAEKVAAEEARRKIKAENARMRAEFLEKSNAAYSDYCQAKCVVEGLARSCAHYEMTGDVKCFPDGHFMDVIYTGTTQDFYGKTVHRYYSHDRNLIPHFTYHMNHYKIQYESAQEKMNAITNWY